VNRWTVLGTVLLGACAGTEQEVAEPAGPLVGAWEVVERSYERGDSAWTEHEPGLYVFSERYYSVQEIREAGGERTTFDEGTTDDERLAAFDVFHAHAGGYTLDGDRLFVTPTLAKGPNTMNGSTYEYGLEWAGEELRITRTSEAENERRVTVLRRVE
jgi:hypothetical protein